MMAHDRVSCVLRRALVAHAVVGSRAASPRSLEAASPGARTRTEHSGHPEARAVQWPGGLVRRIARGAARPGEPGAAGWQQRRSRRQVRRGEPDRGDARRGRGGAVGAPDLRRYRVPRRDPEHHQLVRRLRGAPQRAGEAAGGGVAGDGRRRAAADVPAGGARSPAPGTADDAGAGQGRRRAGGADRVRARWCSAATHRYGTNADGHRSNAQGLHVRRICAPITPRCTSRRTPPSSSPATSGPTP